MKRQELIEEYKILKNEINKFEESIINGERIVSNLNDWINLKNKSYILKRKCGELLRFFLGKNITPDMENKPLLYKTIEYIYDCIEQVEQNYIGKSLIEDLDIIMPNIRNLCINNRINNALSQMEEQTKISFKSGSNVANMKDYYGKDYIISPSFTAEFVKNTILQEQLHEDYKQANEFVFGKNLKR